MCAAIEYCRAVNRDQYIKGLEDKDRYLENCETINLIEQHGDKDQINTLVRVMRGIEKENERAA